MGVPVQILFGIVQGWTAEIGPFVLYHNAVAIDLTSYTSVMMVMTAEDGTLVASPGDVRVDADPTTGKVYWTPSTDATADLGVYTLHWQLTDVDGKVSFVPNGEPDYFTVCRA